MKQVFICKIKIDKKFVRKIEFKQKKMQNVYIIIKWVISRIKLFEIVFMYKY